MLEFSSMVLPAPSLYLVLITNRKSYMTSRLVPKSMTLNDLERRISPKSVASNAYCVLELKERSSILALWIWKKLLKGFREK